MLYRFYLPAQAENILLNNEEDLSFLSWGSLVLLKHPELGLEYARFLHQTKTTAPASPWQLEKEFSD
ncbi:MAG TPA: hypothetical protein PLQ36_01720, partial [Candidatus Gracilibacteria bacterium]|nr:hypothetical protein [Candidatus Gracilibacteria bacterium]